MLQVSSTTTWQKIWAPGSQRGYEAATEVKHLPFLLSLYRGVYPGKCCFTLFIHQDQASCPDHTLTNTPPDRLADPALTFRPGEPSTGSILKCAPHLPSHDLVTQSDMHVCILCINCLCAHVNYGNSDRYNLPDT